MIAVVFLALFLALGVLLWFHAPSTITKWPGLTTYYTVAAAAVIIFAPITTRWSWVEAEAGDLSWKN